MASASMAMPLMSATQNTEALFRSIPLKPSKKAAFVNPKPKGTFKVEASLKEKAATGLAAAALTASMVIPEVAEAAGSSGLTPSLNNFLLSIAAGGVVLVAIIGAVVGVSNFDPVKRA
ncbi:hypothetical protein D8674_032616 [Pyrus ussuriensis x Pyrus communis]|uniref:Ultraviolet-B-repressible protein n=1 Tax=Pyrus ussuriensis x Pyrus communis TaxID=2448454 RepID=A0A5N5HNL3_9ROSA|nr:uncharacterized protein LOC103927490 [Pyrus x bretschneideri]KAB2627821.1 hypothetical protein D8674_032616 [Pyrus ussuriensis x Pyrus communis]